MPLVRKESGEVQFKVVYCGPPRGGKTTNLHYIHRRLDSRLRGDMVSVETDHNRTISFDFLPIHSTKVGDLGVKFQLYTVPGQKVMKATRTAVLAGADAVVFVADSDPGRKSANREALDDCFECLHENHINPASIPFVFQFNKRDITGATSPPELDELLGVDSPTFLASATSGYQVFATLDRVTQMILKGFSTRHVMDTAHHSLPTPQRSTQKTAVAAGGWQG